MTELDLIRSFRADTPPPTASAIATAERAWRRPERRRWWPQTPTGQRSARFALGAIAAVAAVTLALILPAERGGDLGTQEASAAETLRLAAQADQGGLTRPLRPGEYWYVRRETTWNGGPAVREDWVGADGSRRWRMPRETHEVGPTRRPPFYLGERGMTYAQLLALPRDPQALYERLHALAVECECGGSENQETFAIAADALRDNPVPGDLRAALLRAAALIPGIRLVDHARDVAGREGVGVASGRYVLIFDRRTHDLLGESRGRQGSANVESAIVGSPGDRP